MNTPNNNNNNNKRIRREHESPSMAALYDASAPGMPATPASFINAAINGFRSPNPTQQLASLMPSFDAISDDVWKPTSILSHIPKEAKFDDSLEDELLSKIILPTAPEFADEIGRHPKKSILASMGLPALRTNLQMLKADSSAMITKKRTQEETLGTLRDNIAPIQQERYDALKVLEVAQATYNSKNEIYENMLFDIELHQKALAKTTHECAVSQVLEGCISRILHAPIEGTPWGPRAHPQPPVGVEQIRRCVGLTKWSDRLRLTDPEIGNITHIAQVLRYDSHPAFRALWENPTKDFVQLCGRFPELKYNKNNGLTIEQQQDRVALYFGLSAQDEVAVDDSEMEIAADKSNEEIAAMIESLQDQLARRGGSPRDATAGDGGGRRIVRAKRPPRGAEALGGPTNGSTGGGGTDGDGPGSSGTGGGGGGGSGTGGSGASSDDVPTVAA